MRTSRGFTLIEMLVSVAIFSLVMVVALGALLALSEANRKAELLSSATNNFESAIDSMTRTIRTGVQYHCGSGTLTTPTDCADSTAGSNEFAFLSASNQETVYEYGTSACPNGIGCILRSLDGGATFGAITSPEIVVKGLQFYVVGAPQGVQSPQGYSIQPKVVITVWGYAVITAKQKSTFNLETSVTQRIYDQ